MQKDTHLLNLDDFKKKITMSIKNNIDACNFISVNFPYNNLYKVDIKIISSCFENISEVKRQQLVYKHIKDYCSLIHIVKLTTMSENDEMEV